VVAGHDRDDVAVLIVPDTEACRDIDLASKFREVLEDLARESTGSSNRISRAIILTEPLSMDAHEITDKGSINQKSVLNNRGALVEDLYASPPPAHVIAL
jgi:feruloyl-CoA synthase